MSAKLSSLVTHHSLLDLDLRLDLEINLQRTIDDMSESVRLMLGGVIFHRSLCAVGRVAGDDGMHRRRKIGQIDAGRHRSFTGRIESECEIGRRSEPLEDCEDLFERARIGWHEREI